VGRLAVVADLSIHDRKKLDYACETILFSTSDVLVKESENIGLPFSDSRVHEIVPVIRRPTDRRINLQNVRLAEPRQKVYEFPDSDVRIDYPVWSPDGRWVIFGVHPKTETGN
jgi:hypothetical protein